MFTPSPASKISLIVPVYNVQNVLARLLDSVLKQSYSAFECILVDDGSTDGSLVICRQYQALDYRIKVIHQSNQGPSAARNKGLEYASSNFIAFADSDDELEADYLHSLMNVSDDIDLVISGTKNFNVNGELHHVRQHRDYIFNSIDTSAVCEIIDAQAIDGPCSKRFNTSIIRNFGIRFPTILKLSEDTCFVASYLCHCSRVALIPGSPYRYYKYTHGTLTSFNTDYIKNILFSESILTCILASQYKGIENSLSMRKRTFGHYYYAIFQTLNSNRTPIEKLANLKVLFSTFEYSTITPFIEQFTPNDSPLIRFCLKRKAATLLLLLRIIPKIKHRLFYFLHREKKQSNNRVSKQ